MSAYTSAEKGKGRAAPPGPRPEDELVDARASLVPLAVVVERVVGHAFAELSNLVETLPSMGDLPRKRAIVDYVLQTRRQILKLLVVVRWTQESQAVAKCLSIVAFLSRQIATFDEAVQGLTGVKDMLAGARLRNYDLPTAIDVLSTGSYQRLPRRIKDAFTQPERLPDEAVLSTLEELTAVLRYRLAVLERVPRRMRGYRIEDGRVTFRVDGLWEGKFTYGGSNDPDEEAEWYFLGITFLFDIRDGKGLWTRTPTGPMKDHINELTNQQLVRKRKRKKPPDVVGSTSEVTAKAEERERSMSVVPKGKERERSQSVMPRAAITQVEDEDAEDAPLVRAYSFLCRLSLSYQLESIVSQVRTLVLGQSSRWKDNLKYTVADGRATVTIEYWAEARPKPPPPNKQGQQRGQQQQQAAAALPAGPASTLTFSRVPLVAPEGSSAESAAGHAGLRREAALRVALAQTRAEQPKRDSEEDGELERLLVEWKPVGMSEEAKAEVGALEIGTEIVLESLVQRLTRHHAAYNLRQLYKDLLVSPLLHSENFSFSEPIAGDDGEYTEPFIAFRLHGNESVVVRFNSITGRYELRNSTVGNEKKAAASQAVVAVASGKETRLKSASEKLNESRKNAPDTFLRIQLTSIVDQVETRCTVLGLTAARRLTIRPQELGRFGPSARYFLFVGLAVFPGYHLALVLSEQGFRFAVLSTRAEIENGQRYFAIVELAWITKPPSTDPALAFSLANTPLALSNWGFELSLDELRELHSYAVQRVAMHKIETQLRVRNISFQHVAPSIHGANDQAPLPLSRTAPYLVIKSEQLLLNVANVAFPAVSAQVVLKGLKIKVILHVRFRPLGLEMLDFSDMPRNIQLNTVTGVLSFTSDDVEGVVGHFLEAFGLVTRAIVVAYHRRKVVDHARAHQQQQTV